VPVGQTQGGDGHPGPGLLHDLIRAGPGSPASDLLALSRRHCHASTVTQALARYQLLPASAASGLLTRWLCTNMWMTCAQQHWACVCAVEMLGIPLPWRTREGAFTWESAGHALCMRRKPELSTCRVAIDDK